MAVKQGAGKKPRKHKVSQKSGVGARKTRLTTLEKALINPTYLAGKSAAIKRAIERGRPAPKRSARGAVDASFFIILVLGALSALNGLMVLGVLGAVDFVVAFLLVTSATIYAAINDEES